MSSFGLQRVLMTCDDDDVRAAQVIENWSGAHAYQVCSGVGRQGAGDGWLFRQREAIGSLGLD